MKSRIMDISSHKSIVITFDQDLPAFPGPRSQRWLIGNDGMIFNRNYSISHVAAAMVRENAGTLPFEFCKRPYDVYFEFLIDLVAIPGFVGIRHSDRYRLEACIGDLFDPAAVGQNIAELVRKHFYPQQPLAVSSEVNHS